MNFEDVEKDEKEAAALKARVEKLAELPSFEAERQIKKDGLARRSASR